MIELTEEQWQAVEASAGLVRLTDTHTHREYVILRVEAYERLLRLADAEEVAPSFYEFEKIDHTGR